MKSLLFLSLLSLSLCNLLVAQREPPAVRPELRARFGFLGPKAHKIGNGIGFLLPQRQTLLVNNPLRARLEMMTMTAPKAASADDPSSWKIESKPLSTTGELRGLALGDVDGDGTPDIVMLNNRGRLLAHSGQKPETRLAELEVGLGKTSDSLRCVDVDGDKKQDAVLLTSDGLRIVTDIAGKPVVHAAEPLFAERIQSFLVFDFDGDGKQDVLVCSSDPRTPLHFKRGRGNARFGPWTLFHSPRMSGAFIGSHAGGRPSVATIEYQPRRVVEYELRKATDASRPALELTSFGQGTDARPFVHGDVDNDGDKDLVVADPARARLEYLLEEGGQFQDRTVPTLAGIQSLALGDLDGDGKTDLVMASPEEETLAVRYGKSKLDTFPTRLPSVDRPVAVTVVGSDVLFIARDKKRTGALYRISGTDRDAKPTKLAELGRLSRDPQRLWVANLNDSEGKELAFVVPGSELVVLLANEKGGYTKMPSVGAGFTKRIEEGAVCVTGSKGSSALMVVRERFARVFRFDESGQPLILSQDNGPEGIGSMAMAVPMADGSRLYLDRKNNRLYRKQKDRPTVSIDMPAINPTHLLSHGDAALVLGRRGVLRVPFRRSLRLEAVRRHEPPTKKTNYWHGIAADLDGDGRRELALLDSHLHGVHILVCTKEKLERALSFQVFESQDRGGFEPRDIASGDLNGDGRQDLLLIAHDRVLLYLQER